MEARVDTITGEVLSAGHGTTADDPVTVITVDIPVEFEGVSLNRLVYDGNVVKHKPDVDLLAIEKAAAKKLIREEANWRILRKWPYWLQLNIANGLDADNGCTADIATIRSECQAAENAINAITITTTLQDALDEVEVVDPAFTDIGVLTQS